MAASASSGAAEMLSAVDASSYLLLRLADELFAIPSGHVREIARWRAPTPVPGAPSVLLGIINQRGTILPVVNLCELLGLRSSPPDRTTRYVIVSDDSVMMALLVDAVRDLIDLSDVPREALPATLSPQQARLLAAVARTEDRPVCLLAVQEVIAVLRAGA